MPLWTAQNRLFRARTGARLARTEAANVIRVYHRVGRRTGVSMPLWLAVLVYLFVGAAMVELAVVVVAIAVAVVLAFLLVALGAAIVGRVRRRRSSS